MNAKYMDWVEKLAMVLVLVGGLNWGLVGLGGFLGSDLNVVHMVLGSMQQVEWLVYVLVGLSTLWVAYGWWMKMSKGK